MSVYPGDEGWPTPLLKFYGELVVAPAPTVYVGDDMFLGLELINMGTAPTRHGDQLWASLALDSTVTYQDHVDIPEIGPNGSTWKHVFKIDGHHVVVPERWMLIASVTGADTGEILDEQRAEFQVSPRD